MSMQPPGGEALEGSPGAGVGGPLQLQAANDESKLHRQEEDEFTIPDEMEEEEIERDAEGIVQAKADSSGTPQVTLRVQEYLNGMRSGGAPLPAAVRTLFEPRFGYDFGQVQIHAGSQGDRLTRALRARAVTWGHNIAFRAGEYAPDQAAGQSLLAHELAHVVQQRAAAPTAAPGDAVVHPSATTSQPMLQRKDCNFYVYDSTEPTSLGRAWKWAAVARALPVRGGYVIGSSDTIEYMLRRILRTFSDKGCDCIEEIQFWSHGSAGDSMHISKTGDEFTAADFNIPDLDKYGKIPSLSDMVSNRAYTEAWNKWFNALTWRQQLLVEVRSYICGPDAEIYYRSCSAFQGKKGQEFAKASATFWRSKVIGHTKIIGLTQPGQKTLKPGQEPYWSEEEGERTEMKKGDKKPKKY
jgi:hypothetical protein